MRDTKYLNASETLDGGKIRTGTCRSSTNGTTIPFIEIDGKLHRLSIGNAHALAEGLLRANRLAASRP